MLKTLYQRIPDENGYLYGMNCRGVRLYRYSININGFIFDHVTNSILSPEYTRNNKDGKPYPVVSIIYPDGSFRRLSLRSLIAENFIPVTEDDVKNNRIRVVAISDDTKDCSVKNLERKSISEIAHMSYDSGNGRTHRSKYDEYWSSIDTDLANLNLSINEIFDKWNPICGITYDTLSKRATSLGYIRKNRAFKEIKAFVYDLLSKGYDRNSAYMTACQHFNYIINKTTYNDWVRFYYRGDK